VTRPIPRGPRAAAIVAALTALVCLVMPRVSAASGDAAFRKLADEFTDHWIATRPYEAIRAGMRDHDAKTLVLSDATIDAEHAWREDFGRRYHQFVLRYPMRKMSAAMQVDRRLLEARFDRMTINLEIVQPYKRDPSAYLPAVDGPVRLLLAGRPGSPCSRERDIAKQLSAVPEVLRAAQSTLTVLPGKPVIEAAIRNYSRTLDLYRKSLPRAVRECRDATATADLAVADTLAARALETFVDWLKNDLLPRAPDSTMALGAETYARILRDETLRADKLEDMEREVNDALTEARGRRDSIAALVKSTPTSPARSDSALRNFAAHTLEDARAFVRKRRLASLTPKDGLRQQSTPPGADPAGGFGVVPDDEWLWHGEKLDWRVSAATANGASYGDMKVEVLRDGYPGRGMRLLSRKKGKLSRLRGVFASPATADAWSDYMLGVMLDTDYVKDDPAVALAAENRVLETLARQSAEFAIHAHGASLAEAAAAIARTTGADSTRAADLALEAAIAPGTATAAFERLGLLELRDLARQRGKRRYKTQKFTDAVLREGPVPVAGVRDKILSGLPHARLGRTSRAS